MYLRGDVEGRELDDLLCHAGGVVVVHWCMYVSRGERYGGAQRSTCHTLLGITKCLGRARVHAVTSSAPASTHIMPHLCFYVHVLLPRIRASPVLISTWPKLLTCAQLPPNSSPPRISLSRALHRLRPSLVIASSPGTCSTVCPQFL